MVEKICRKLGTFFAYCLKLSGYEFANKEKMPDSETKNNEFFNDDLIHKWLYGGEVNGKRQEQE